MATSRALISVVSPVYEEEEVLPHFHRVLGEVLDGLADEYDAEIILVDDGSRDGTLPLLRQMAADDPACVSFPLAATSATRPPSPPASKTPAATRSSPSIATCNIRLLLFPSWCKSGERVMTWWRRCARKTAPSALWKRLTSRVFFRLMRLLSEEEVREAASDYQLLSRKALQALLLMQETHRFLRGMVNWLGFPTATVPFRVAEREAGESKFTFRRLTAFAADALLSFSKIPLRLPFFLGAAVGFIGLLYAVYGLIRTVVVGEPLEPGWFTVLATLHLIGGSILCSISLVGEYVGRIYEQVKGRPLYLLKETSPEIHAESRKQKTPPASAA